MICAVGIDLAWKPAGVSGLCIFRDGKLIFWEASAFSDRQLVDRIAAQSPACDNLVVSIDAPLHVPNESGIRSCEQAFKKTRIHGHSVSILGSNRKFLVGQFGLVRGENIRQLLEAKQIRVIETFPTASVIGLFGRRIPYKFSSGKRKADVIRGMEVLTEALLSHPWFAGFSHEIHSCILSILSIDAARKDLKLLEDKLDALLCAYTAWQVASVSDQVRVIHGDGKDGSMIYTLAPDPLF